MTTVAELLAPPSPATMPADGTPTIIGGRYHTLHPETGERTSFQRASNFAKVLSDDFGLQQWMMRMVLLGAAMRPDLTAQAIAVGAAATPKLNELANAAKEAAGGSKGANLGTAMHSLIERIEAGEQVGPLPVEMQADIDAYRTTLNTAGVIMQRQLLERIVCCPELGVTGRLDGVATVEGWPLDVVTDNKTGKHMQWLEWAIQLAVYARAPYMWQPGQGWIAKPAVDLQRALVIHLPIGQGVCGLHVLDIEAGWQAALQAVTVKRWRNRRDLARPLTATVRAEADLSQLLEDSLAGECDDREVSRRTRGALATSPTFEQDRGAGEDDATAGVDALPPRDTAYNNPRFIAERVEWNRKRLAVVLQRLNGKPLPVARPVMLPAPGETYLAWREVEILERWITGLEKATATPFPDPPPDVDPFDGFGPTRKAHPDPIVVREPVVWTPPEVRNALKARFDALPDDLQAVATATAKTMGCADVEHLTEGQVAKLGEIIARAEADHVRKGAV